MINLLRRLAARHLVLLLVTMIVFGGFELIIPAVISTLDMPNLLGGVLAMLPAGVGTVLSEQVFGGLSTQGLLGFGWNHPIAHAAGTAVAVVIGARAVAGEADNGTLELVLAQPISRTRYLLAHVVFALLALLLLCAAGVVGTLVGTRLFAVGEIRLLNILRVAFNLFLLLTALFTATLLSSVAARDAGRALGAGFIIAITSFLSFTVALLWPAATFLRPFSLHTYYLPRDVLVTNHIAGVSLVVLIGWSATCLFVAFIHFTRRDIP